MRTDPENLVVIHQLVAEKLAIFMHFWGVFDVFKIIKRLTSCASRNCPANHATLKIFFFSYVLHVDLCAVARVLLGSNLKVQKNQFEIAKI